MVGESTSDIMRFYNLNHFGLACLLMSFAVTGCQTDESNSTAVRGSIKTQGVYTTLAIPNLGLDLPAAGYMQKDSFGPGETPAAVIAGYGGYNQQLLVTLKLVELSTGRILLSQDYYASYGKVLMQPLAIRLSGKYELKLMDGETELDSCQFTVTHTNQFGTMEVANAKAGANYAQGTFLVSVDPDSLPDYFAEYNDNLVYWVVNSVSEEAGSTNAYLFAQQFPGKVVIQCRLDYKGRITEPKILENTLDDNCGNVFLKALLDRSPYGPWPEDVHQKLNADNHEVKLTIYLK